MAGRGTEFSWAARRAEGGSKHWTRIQRPDPVCIREDRADTRGRKAKVLEAVAFMFWL